MCFSGKVSAIFCNYRLLVILTPQDSSRSIPCAPLCLVIAMRFFCILVASLHVLSLAGNETQVGNEKNKVAGFETNKWKKQRQINKAFCGTESYELETSGKWCKSWWLPPQRWDTLIINTVSACAVCAFASAGASCPACGQAAVVAFFEDMARSHANAVSKMGKDIQRRAGRLLSNWWNDILKAKWYHADVSGWRVEARGGWETYKGRECQWGICGPWISGQTQAYVQVSVHLKGHFFKVKNSCHKKVQVAIRYKRTNGQWASECWWQLNPNQSFYLANNGDRLITENKIWYYYAEEIGGSRVWSGTDNTKTCGGRTLRMKEKNYVNSDQDLYLGLTCSNAKSSEVGEDPGPGLDSDADGVGERIEEIPGADNASTRELLP